VTRVRVLKSGAVLRPGRPSEPHQSPDRTLSERRRHASAASGRICAQAPGPSWRRARISPSLRSAQLATIRDSFALSERLRGLPRCRTLIADAHLRSWPSWSISVKVEWVIDFSRNRRSLSEWSTSGLIQLPAVRAISFLCLPRAPPLPGARDPLHSPSNPVCPRMPAHCDAAVLGEIYWKYG
jgi:hypothetical protein